MTAASSNAIPHLANKLAARVIRNSPRVNTAAHAVLSKVMEDLWNAPRAAATYLVLIYPCSTRYTSAALGEAVAPTGIVRNVMILGTLVKVVGGV